MNRVKNFITIAAFSFLVLGLPAMASAQYGQYDPYGRNGGNNNGGYGNGSYGNMRLRPSAILRIGHATFSANSTVTSTAAGITERVVRIK